jgi:hypothetical protein
MTGMALQLCIAFTQLQYELLWVGFFGVSMFWRQRVPVLPAVGIYHRPTFQPTRIPRQNRPVGRRIPFNNSIMLWGMSAR